MNLPLKVICYNRFWGGGEARHWWQMGSTQQQQQQRQTHNAPWVNTGRQYGSAGTLRSCISDSGALFFYLNLLLCFCPPLRGWFYRLTETKLTSLRGQVVRSPNSAMTSPAKFRKDKEIVAEYETQVKGKTFFSKLPLLLTCNITSFVRHNGTCLDACLLVFCSFLWKT